VVFWIQKEAYLPIVFHRLKGMCNDLSSSIAFSFFALIFVKKYKNLLWFCTLYFFSPHVLITIIRRAFALICTISCQQGCIRDDCCFFGLLFSSGTFNVSYRALYLTLIMFNCHTYIYLWKALGGDVPKALQLRLRKAWSACSLGHNRVYLWKQFPSELHYRHIHRYNKDNRHLLAQKWHSCILRCSNLTSC
jgi:hypothetical protein